MRWGFANAVRGNERRLVTGKANWNIEIEFKIKIKINRNEEKNEWLNEVDESRAKRLKRKTYIEWSKKIKAQNNSKNWTK